MLCIVMLAVFCFNNHSSIVVDARVAIEAAKPVDAVDAIKAINAASVV